MRARNLKPGFFKSEELSRCCFAARLLFEGLWCEADREGRLKLRPGRIRIEVFPYPTDNVDIVELLRELNRESLIIFYEVDDEKFIYIPTFLSHQHPHKTERASKLPPFLEDRRIDSILTVKQPLNNGSVTEVARMNHESCNMNDEEVSLLSKDDNNSVAASGNAVPYQKVEDWWNKLASDIGSKKILKMSDGRKAKLKSRWKHMNGKANELEKMIRKAKEINGWSITFDFLIRNDTNFLRILEGQFDK